MTPSHLTAADIELAAQLLALKKAREILATRPRGIRNYVARKFLAKTTREMIREHQLVGHHVTNTKEGSPT